MNIKAVVCYIAGHDWQWRYWDRTKGESYICLWCGKRKEVEPK